MSETIELCIDRASVAELTAHLSRCDAAFVPPLSERVTLDAYAQKISDRAMRFEAWHAGEMMGLVATYCNTPDKRTAFITSVSVLPSWQGRGIAARLMTHCIDHVRNQGFEHIELEVDRRNPAAVALYEKNGFAIRRMDGTSLTMTLAIGK